MILSSLLSLVLLGLIISLIIGLINPKIILRWVKKPTRAKVIGYFFLSFITTFIIFSVTLDDSELEKDRIENAEKLIEQGKFDKVRRELASITNESPNFDKAQKLIKYSDSLIQTKQLEIEKRQKEEEIKKKEALELEKKKQIEKEINAKKKRLQKEINSIKKGVDFSVYKKTPDGLRNEIALFALWGQIINEGILSKDKEVRKLAKLLKLKVRNIQIHEFPLLRKQNAKLLNNTLWENDITVKAFGKGYKYLYFTGSVFVTNKNIKEFQKQTSDMFYLFRYKQIRYRWYDNAEEYTYYDLETERDSEIVTF